MTNSQIKVLIFDMDGTIIDSDPVIIDTWTELIRAYKPEGYKIDLDEIRTYSGPPVIESIKKVFPEYDPNFILKEYRTRTAKYYKNLTIFPHCKETLNKFFNEGYKLSIVTSKNTERCVESLKQFGIDNLFDYIVTADDVTKGKPDPEGMNKVLEYYKVDKEEVFDIGDTDYDFYASKNAGIKCILMKMCKRFYKNDVKPYYFVNNYDELYKVVEEYGKQQ